MESKRVGKSSVKKVNWKDVLRPVAVFPFRPFLPPTIAPIVVSFAAVFWAVTQRWVERCVTAQKTAAKETTPIVACNSQATYLILLLALLRKTIKTYSGFVD